MSLSEVLDRATFAVTSPNRAVRIEASMRGDLDLRILKTPERGELERELAAALTAWTSARSRVFRQAADHVRTEAGLPPTADPPERASRLTEALTGIRAEGLSRNRWVTIRWEGLDAFAVEIDPVPMRRTAADMLRFELLSAVYAVINDHREQHTKLRRRVLGRVFATKDEQGGSPR